MDNMKCGDPATIELTDAEKTERDRMYAELKKFPIGLTIIACGVPLPGRKTA